MIVDCHTHISYGEQDVDTTEHLAACQTVDAAIVLADARQPYDKTNKTLSEYVKQHQEKMVGFAVIEPTRAGLTTKELTVFKEKLGLAGAVLYCCRCGFHPVHSRAMQFYQAAEQLSMPVFFHNGSETNPRSVLDYAQPYLLDEVARTFPDLKIIIGGMGQPFLQQTLMMIAKHENVFADLAIRPDSIWKVYNTIIAAYEADVMDKLFFGSGYPFGSAGECIETLLGFNKLLGDISLPRVPRGEIRNIVERDTLRLLGIEHSIPAMRQQEHTGT
jgi:hypothetical protein